ncbi:hypothetical protein C9974_14585, partial [Marinobacter sp. B9-2]
MMPQKPPFRWALLLLATVVTFVALAIASPEETVELNTLGESAVNTAPAIRIKLAGEPAPKPDAAPKPEPKPEPEPEPEPESVAVNRTDIG